jgi:uncharacterized protein (TIGR02246 family)
MTKWITMTILAGASALVFGQAKAPAKPAVKPVAASVEQTILQLEHDWSQSEVKKDATAFAKIVADDWILIDYTGRPVNKQQAIADLKNGAYTVQSQVLADLKVRVLGTTAVATGRDTETSMERGKSTTGTYAWTDVFTLRDGRWQIVASQETKVP